MKISYSVVFYNNPDKEVQALCDNIVETVPKGLSYQVFLVNNSPRNNQLQKRLNQIAAASNHIIVIKAESNRGFGAGHNLAIRQADSDYHFIVNPDIKIPDSSQIAKMIHYIARSTNQTVMLNPRIVNTDGSVQKVVKHQPSVLDMGIRFLGSRVMKRRQSWFVYGNQYGQTHEAEVLSGAFALFDTAKLKQIGGFDERYFLYMEDTDISREMAQFGKLMYLADVYVIHDWQRQNRKSISGITQMLRSMRKYFNKWGWHFV